MIERMKDAAQLAQMGPAEKLLGALQVALLGLGITFVVLLVLMGCIRLFSRLAAEKRFSPAPAPAPAKPPELDGETVAVLFSAISMMEGGSDFRIVNVTPAPEPRNWVAQGRAEQLASRRPGR